jgi:hypothetical protein
MLLLQPGGEGVGEVLRGAFMVGAPGAGDASRLLDGDALPALGEGAGEARISVAIRSGLNGRSE